MADPTELYYQSYYYDPFQPQPEPEPDPAEVSKALNEHIDYYKNAPPNDSKRIPERSALQDVVEALPARVIFGDYDAFFSGTGEDNGFEALYNPNEFESGVEQEWARFSSPGASYAHLHYHSTKNYIVEMELYYVANTLEDYVKAEKHRRLLHSWMFPRRTNAGWSLGPPKLLVVWPETFELVCYLVDCRFKHLKFSLAGGTTRWTASIRLERTAEQFVGAHQVKQRIIGVDEPILTPEEKLRRQGPLFRVGDTGKAVLRGGLPSISKPPRVRVPGVGGR